MDKKQLISTRIDNASYNSVKNTPDAFTKNGDFTSKLIANLHFFNEAGKNEFDGRFIPNEIAFLKKCYEKQLKNSDDFASYFEREEGLRSLLVMEIKDTSDKYIERWKGLDKNILISKLDDLSICGLVYTYKVFIDYTLGEGLYAEENTQDIYELKINISEDIQLPEEATIKILKEYNLETTENLTDVTINTGIRRSGTIKLTLEEALKLSEKNNLFTNRVREEIQLDTSNYKKAITLKVKKGRACWVLDKKTILEMI